MRTFYHGTVGALALVVLIALLWGPPVAFLSRCEYRADGVQCTHGIGFLLKKVPK